MPVAPKIDRQVVTQPIGGGRLSTDVPIGDTSQSQNAAFKILQEAKSEADKLAVNDAFNTSLQQSNTLLHDDKVGALNTKGKDAIGVHPKVQAEWDAHVNATLERLQNDEQKNAYLAKANALWATMDRQIQRHTSVETLRFDNQVTKDSIAAWQEAAVKNASDEELVGEFINSIKELNQDYARRNGLDAKPLVDEAVSDTHKKIILQKLVDGNDLAAVDYFKKHEGEIQDSLKIQEQLNIASTNGNAERLALKEFDAIKPDALGQKDITKAIDKIRRSRKPQKVKDAAINKLKIMANEHKSRITQEENVKLSTVYADIASGATEEDIRRNPNWINLRDGRKQEQVIKFLRTEKRISSTPTDSQLLAFGELTDDKLASMTNEALVAMMPDLGPTLLRRAQTRKKRLESEADKVNTAIENKYFAEIAASIGINTTKRKKSSDDKLAEAKLRSDFYEAIHAFQQAHNRPAHPEEVKAIMQEVADRTTMVAGHFFGSSLVPTATLTESQINRALPSDTDKERIAKALQTAGKPVTEDKIVETFREELRTDISINERQEAVEAFKVVYPGRIPTEDDIRQLVIDARRK
jgi:hypothetical protein